MSRVCWSSLVKLLLLSLLVLLLHKVKEILVEDGIDEDDGWKLVGVIGISWGLSVVSFKCASDGVKTTSAEPDEYADVSYLFEESELGKVTDSQEDCSRFLPWRLLRTAVGKNNRNTIDQ